MADTKQYHTAIVWLRRDLRVMDNAALHHACLAAQQVVPLFILDETILRRPDTGAARVAFLLDALRVLDTNLQARGGRLVVREGKTPDALMQAVQDFGAEAVFHHREYEPFGTARDAKVKAALDANDTALHTFKDVALFESGEIVSHGGHPYTVFSPYKRVWFDKPADAPLPTPQTISVPDGAQGIAIPSADILKFQTQQAFACGGETAAQALLQEFLQGKVANYGAERDLLAHDGTSRLSRHLHLGTLGMRTMVDAVRQVSQKGRDKPNPNREAQSEHQTSGGGAVSFLNEMAWHDFYLQILAEFPHVAGGAFRPQFDALEWENDSALFEAWKQGRTGYPIVDAAMRQLNSEAWMHNRGRMIVASFLTKDLLIDWRWGERYFMEQLVDGDQAANNGGWQWAAGTGTDAQPFFRIFNPTLQGEKFDPEGAYVRRWVPELAALPTNLIHTPWKLSRAERAHLGAAEYPNPVVDHAAQRAKALALYQKAVPPQ